MGDKTGVAVGIIATQLSNKFALSGTVSHSQLLDSSRFNDVVYLPTRIYQAINYSLSSGYLLFPREYKNFNQLNVSVFLELLAQQTISPGKYYFDLAPAAQFILNSNLKLNLSYRAQLSSDMQRISKNKWQFSLERTFLNTFPKNKKAS